MNQNEANHHQSDHSDSHGSSALTPVSLAHGINQPQSALKPLAFPLVLRDLNFGYSELGVAAAVGGSLQLAAGALGRIMPRHLILGLGNASVGRCFVLVGLAQSFSQFFLWSVMSRIGGAAQHSVGAALLSHHFHNQNLGVALATHFTAGNVEAAAMPPYSAILIGLWGWPVTTILFTVSAILVGEAMCVRLKDPASQRSSDNTLQTGSFWQDSRHAIGSGKLRWILVAAVVAAGGFGHGVISSFLPLYLDHNLGMDAPTLGVIFTIMSIGSIVGPMLTGKLSDRHHPQRVLLACYALCAATALVIPWLGASLIGISLAVFGLGAVALGTNPILQILVAESSSERLRDTGFAWFYTATFLAGGLWSPAVGYLSEWLGLKAAFGAMAASFVLASLCVLIGRLDEITLSHGNEVTAHSHH